ncbi:MAG: zinc ribbon domain-containing protein [Deltaproteobacteria bacterium]|nr:zinc ribbon domain-containing protein [Deltaproteobacteria bacterium]
MPIYEYVCEKCNGRFEAFQRMSDAPINSCSACGGPAHKIISHSSFILKGSGWYVTDYGKGTSAASKTTDAACTPSKEASAKTDSPAKCETATASD